MGKIQQFENALNPALLLHKTSNAGTEVLLKESKPEPGLKSVRIGGLPSGALVFTTDGEACGIRNQYLNPQAAGLGKGCDAVVIYEGDDGLHAVFCEMKSFQPKPRDYEPQLLHARLLVAYLCQLLSSIEKETFALAQERFVLFHLQSPHRMQKGLTHARPQAPNFRFDKMESGGEYVHKVSFLAPSGRQVVEQKVVFSALWK
jgi:hypothetical protein